MTTRQDHVPRAEPGLKGDTLLMHAVSAWPSTLEDLLDRRDAAVVSMEDAALLRPAHAISFHAHAPPALYRLTTYTGRSIEATADQSFLTRHGWRQLSALSTDDAVAVVAEYPDFFGRGDTDADLVKLLAYLTAAGTRGDGISPPFTDVDVRGDFEAAVNSKGDACRPISTVDGATQLHVHGRFGERSKVLDYLELVGVHELASIDMFVPDFVFGLKRDKLRLYLSRLFSVDGRIETSGRLIYRTTSLRMARQVQHLLARFGVVALLRGVERVERGGELDAVDLAICTKADVVRFIDDVGFLGEKSHRAEVVRAALYHVRATDPSLARLGPILFDRVVAVEPTAAAPVFSLVFETTHNFIANDFVVQAAAHDERSGGR
jgi:replicative DNA helicase